jgi:hypothetical protein
MAHGGYSPSQAMIQKGAKPIFLAKGNPPGRGSRPGSVPGGKGSQEPGGTEPKRGGDQGRYLEPADGPGERVQFRGQTGKPSVNKRSTGQGSKDNKHSKTGDRGARRMEQERQDSGTPTPCYQSMPWLRKSFCAFSYPNLAAVFRSSIACPSLPRLA